MAKENKARGRVFFGEVEGDNETIRDGLRSIAAAVNKTFQSGPTIVKLLGVDTAASDEELLDQVEQELAETAQADEAGGDPAPAAARVTKPAGQKKPKPATYSFVKDLDLRPEGEKSLRDFFAEKAPQDQQQQLTVVLYYLHHMLKVPSITCNHVYTGLKEVNVPVSTNLAQALRNVSNRKGWIDTSDSNALKTTVAGENFVEHDLPGPQVGKSGDVS